MDINVLHLQEAVRTTAMSHPDECACYICAAATGDSDAMERVIEDLTYLNAEDPDDSDRLLN